PGRSDKSASDLPAPPDLPDLLRRRASRRRRLQRQLLHAPVQELGHVDLVLAGARDLVNPAELFCLMAGLAEISEHLAVERQLVDASGIRVAAVEELLALRVRRRHADGPRRAG